MIPNSNENILNPGLSGKRVLVAGAGALGNEVIKNLALMGVGELIIVDFDTISDHNLARTVLFRSDDVGRIKAEVAAERIHEMRPEIKIAWLNGDIAFHVGLGLIRSCDLILGCVDNRLARLYINRLAFQAGIPWINGGILNFSGQVNVYMKGKSCYECELTTSAWKDIRTRMGCADMARRYANTGSAPTTAVAASVIGGMMVQEAVRLLVGEESPVQGKMLQYEGQSCHLGIYESLPLKEMCGSHFDDVAELTDYKLNRDSPVHELDKIIPDEPVSIELRHGFITHFVDREGNTMEIPAMPAPLFTEELKKELENKAGREIFVPRGALVSRPVLSDLALKTSFRSLGYAFNDVVSISVNGNKVNIVLDSHPLFGAKNDGIVSLEA